MHRYCSMILNYLKSRGSASADQLIAELGLGEDKVLWALEVLKREGAIEYKRDTVTEVSLTEEGKSYIDMFPEERLVKSVAEGKVRAVGDVDDKIGLNWAKRNGWITIDGGKLSLTKLGASIEQSGRYALRDTLRDLSAGGDTKRIMLKSSTAFDSLKRRHLIDVHERGTIGTIRITDTGNSINDNVDEISYLDREIIKGRLWEGKRFSEYDVNISYGDIYPARMHPMHEFINMVRETWLSMGFVEGSGPIVNPAFWNFDVLLTPQHHPARDMQDTFFLSDPDTVGTGERSLLKRVKAAHERSFGTDWDVSLAKRALLRTHNTVVSARYIRELGSSRRAKYPIKAFFVGRVFRNESIDYKHRAEFYQSDGIIVGDNLTFSNLIFELREFFGRLLGESVAESIMLRPSYFPFTEPSLEIFYFDKNHKDYIELGGAGIIREEITGALGMNKRVLAWGLGLDRLLFDRMGIYDINEIYRNRVGWLRARKSL